MSDDALLPEALLARYRPQRVLGAGGFGRVVQAEDLQLGRPVAIKLLHQVDEEQAARMAREAKVAASLRHPHVLELLDHGVLPDGTPYLVTPFVDGQDLQSLARTRPPAPEDLDAWARQVAEALAAAHEAGIVHRDVKPENVLVTRTGDAVLCDFGLARHQAGATFATREGLLLGTPEFMAPELWYGRPASPASDQWAWAAMVHMLRGGQAPYPAREPGRILDALKRGWTPPGDCPPALARALARDPARRYPDMAAALAALDAGPPGDAPVARTVTLGAAPDHPLAGSTMAGARLPTMVATPAPRRRALPILVGLVGFVALGWLLSPEPVPEPPPPSPEAPSPAAPRRAPIPGTTLLLPPTLAAELTELDQHLGYFDASAPYQAEAQERATPGLLNGDFQVAWMGALEATREYFAGAPDDPEVAMALFGFFAHAGQVLRSLTLMGISFEEVIATNSAGDLTKGRLDTGLQDLFDTTSHGYLVAGDLAALSSAELALRAVLSGRTRLNMAPEPPLQDELLRRVRAAGPGDPWAALAFGELYNLSGPTLGEREAWSRKLLDGFAAAPGPPSLVLACAHTRILAWLVANRDRPAGSAILPEDLARLAPLVARCRERLSNGQPYAAALVNELDAGLGEMIVAGRGREMGDAWRAVPALLPPIRDAPRPFSSWAPTVSITHLMLLVRRLGPPGAARRPETPDLVDRALAAMRLHRRGPDFPIATEVLVGAAKTVGELASRLPTDSPARAPLREFAAEDLDGLKTPLRQLQRDLPQALGFGARTDLVSTTLETFRESRREE